MGESRIDVETGNEEEQEPEDCGRIVYRNWCAVCVNGRWETSSIGTDGGRRKRANNPNGGFLLRFLDTGECRHTTSSDLSMPCLWSNGTGCEWKGPKACQIPLMFDLIKDLESLRIILKDENEQCVVMEMKRQCRNLRTSAEHNTSDGITDIFSLLNWISHFAMQLLNKMRIGGDGKTSKMR